MRILISGASGLIGTALQEQLVRRGDDVVTLVRPSTHPAQTTHVAWDPSVSFIDGDALEREGPFDAVVHLAGAGIADKRWTSARKAEILSSRTNSTELLASALCELSTRPEVFVSGSAIGIYGSRGDELLDEASTSGEGFLADVCRSWEAAASPAVDAGIRCAFARTGIVLATSGGALAKQLPLFRLGLGGQLSSGRQWLSWISLDDEIRALLALIDSRSYSGPVNLTAPEPVTNAQFTKELGHALNRPSLFRVPAPALKLALGGELVDEALLASQRVLPRVLLEQSFAFAHPTLSGAFAALV